MANLRRVTDQNRQEQIKAFEAFIDNPTLENRKHLAKVMLFDSGRDGKRGFCSLSRREDEVYPIVEACEGCPFFTSGLKSYCPRTEWIMEEDFPSLTLNRREEIQQGQVAVFILACVQAIAHLRIKE